MSKRGTSPSGASGASRRLLGVSAEWSSRIDVEEDPVGEKTGLPLVMCPDCGLARVVERRSAKENANIGRAFFHCARNSYPKLCGYYRFQRPYLANLKSMGIVKVRKQNAVELYGDAVEGADATSRNRTILEGKVETNMEKKMEDLMWKFNMLMLGFAVVVGALIMYLAVSFK